MCFFYTVRGRRSGKGSCAGAPARSLQSGRLHSIAEPYESYQRTFPERIPHEQSWFRTRHRAPPARSGRYGPALETRRHRRAAALRQQCRREQVLRRELPHPAHGLHGRGPHPGTFRALRLGQISGQGTLRGAAQGLAPDLPQRLHLPGQDLLSRGQRQPAGLLQPHRRLHRRRLPSPHQRGHLPSGRLARGGRGHQGPLDLQGRGLQ